MLDQELGTRFAEELTALENSGAVLPLHFRPSEAFYLLALLQVALRHPAMNHSIDAGKFGKDLAQDIERRVCRTPAMQEVARQGWDPKYDQKTEAEAPAAGEPARGPETKTRADAAKQSGKRGARK